MIADLMFVRNSQRVVTLSSTLFWWMIEVT